MEYTPLDVYKSQLKFSTDICTNIELMPKRCLPYGSLLGLYVRLVVFGFYSFFNVTLLMGVGTVNSNVPLTSIPGKSPYHRDSNARRIITYGADFGANFSVAQASPNWSSGASNNYNGNGFLSAFAQVKRTHTSFDNVFKINVGGIRSRQIDNNQIRYYITKKNLDNIFLDSKFGHVFPQNNQLSAYGGLNFQTQLLNGYKYVRNAQGREVGVLNSSFLSQGVTQLAVGLEFKPSTRFFVRMGYFTLKQTYVLNQDLYATRNEEVIARVAKGDFINNQLGVQTQLGLVKEFGPSNIYKMKFNYLGFAPYYATEAVLDSRIDFNFVAKLSKYVNINYTLISIFDKDLVKPGASAWQNSWVFGLGYLYQL